MSETKEAEVVAAHRPTTGVAYDLGHALAEEFRAVHGAELPAANEAAYRAAMQGRVQSALCLSGGGIRSAAFSLGVLQALARGKLLAQFDYLSTVSGGGFAGAWLQALIREHGGVEKATALLDSDQPPAALTRLRGFTNYLTPQPGMLSEDSWTGIVLYLRNLLINWFGFGAIFVVAVLLAIFYRTALWSFGQLEWTWVPLMTLAGLALLLGTWGACSDLPSHRPMRRQGKLAAVAYYPDAKVRGWIVYPLVAWAFFTPLTVAHWLAPDTQATRGGNWIVPPAYPNWFDTTAPGPTLGIWTLPAVYAAAMLLGYLAAAVTSRAVRLYSVNLAGWIVATLVSAAFIWLGLHLSWYLQGSDNQAEVLAVLGPVWLILSNVLQSTMHVALRKEALLGDLDREWLARLSALKLRYAVLWMLFAFCALSLQRVAFHTPGSEWPFWIVPLITMATGPLAAWLGQRSGAIVADLSKRLFSAGPPTWLLPMLAMVFAVGLFTLLGQVVSETLGVIQQALPGWVATNSWWLLVVQAGAILLLGALIAQMMRRVDVNRFSMHGVYRNRLTRAFLGAARDRRHPDPFTGFDPDDNPRMAELAEHEPRKLFPVVNLTLNLTATSRNAWAERKAAAFTVTPVSCGSAELARGRERAGCYVPTGDYAGQEHETARSERKMGMTLATAMTISGAAVSPNWGYHSSPVTAFLMTLFNLRLGAWLPNPAVVTDGRSLGLARPRHAFAPMLGDLLGDATDKSQAIYLSDGGHFDNLGLYEMVRRRCRLIVVVDAGQDFACDFEDLGAAIRKTFIDQRIKIDFDPPPRVRGRTAMTADSLAFATATIRYPDGELPGRLLYIKPCFLADVPADVRAYGATHPNFPHESTLDQWFTESQFESYRHLGEHQMRVLIDAAGHPSNLKVLLRQARRKARPAVVARATA